jgi:hypothetical protein
MEKEFYICNQKRACSKSPGCFRLGGDCAMTTEASFAMSPEEALALDDLVFGGIFYQLTTGLKIQIMKDDRAVKKLAAYWAKIETMKGAKTCEEGETNLKS